VRALPKPALVDEELVCACSCSLAGALVYLSSDFRRWADGPSLLYGAQGWLFNGPTGTIASVSVGPTQLYLGPFQQDNVTNKK
jgi:hypothetical protein